MVLPLDGYIYIAAFTVEEAKQLIEAGFEIHPQHLGIKLFIRENEKCRQFGKSAAGRT
ncbi:MAG: hypothetical protein QXQ94_10845 [Candidatus Bathyarchaeia archaeon]